MKIILASDLSSLLKYGYELTGIPKSEMKVGYITTAFKAARDQSFFERVKVNMIENGYPFEEIDIANKSKEELLIFFKDKNIIHMEGGNTYYLLKIIRESGFNEVLQELLNAGKVYIGTSAGAYVMTPSIEICAWKDDGKDKFGITDFTAMNYVPFVLKVHYKDEMEASMKNKMHELKYPLRILRDGQGIFIENNTVSFFGEGEEIKL